MNEQSERLVRRMEEMAKQSRFPVWVTDADLGFTGCMRAIGITMPDGLALAFELVEFSPSEMIIQPLVTCISTRPLPEWIRPGEASPLVTEDALLDPDTGMPREEIGPIVVQGVSRSFELNAARDSLAENGYPVDDESESPVRALTYLVCDSLPAEELFSSVEYIRSAFDLDPAARALFSITRWEHPGTEIYEGEELEVSRYPDLMEMAEALGEGRSELSLTGTPNTQWRQREGER